MAGNGVYTTKDWGDRLTLEEVDENGEPSHIYRLDGKIKPSVTQVLRENGLVKVWKNDQWYAERGKNVHKAISLICSGKLDYNTIGDVERPYIDAFLAFQRDEDYIPAYWEHKIYSPLYDIAGQFDSFGYSWKRGVMVKIDWKTSADIPKWVALQLAAYYELSQLSGERWAVQLKPDGTYKITTFRDYQDFDRVRAEFIHYRNLQIYGA